MRAIGIIVFLFVQSFEVVLSSTCTAHIYAVNGTGQYIKIPSMDNAMLDFSRYVGTENYRCETNEVIIDRLQRVEPQRNELPNDVTKNKASTLVASTVPPNKLSSAAIDPLVQKYAAVHNLDPLLIHAMIKVESNYNASAVSNMGAIGLMQLMPDTASELGVVDPYDPEQNIKGGVTYFAQKLEETGTIELALAAYNAGLGSVQNNSGVPGYEETEKYVVKIQKYWELAKASFVKDGDS